MTFDHAGKPAITSDVPGDWIDTGKSGQESVTFCPPGWKVLKAGVKRHIRLNRFASNAAEGEQFYGRPYEVYTVHNLDLPEWFEEIEILGPAKFVRKNIALPLAPRPNYIVSLETEAPIKGRTSK